MKTSILLGCLLLFILPAFGQLYISPGAEMRMNGNARLTLRNADLVNHGTFLPGTGLVSFTGNSTSVIGGTQPVVFNDIEIKKTNGSIVLLQQPVNVFNLVRFTSGNLDLNNNILYLGTTGSLLGEIENSRITGTNGGDVLFSTTLNSPNAANLANLGAVITSAQNLGTVLIRRGHKSQVNNYGIGNSVQRYYDIVPMDPVPFTATLRLNYFDAELNGLTENSLVFWNSSDNLHWINEDFTLGNSNLNYMEKTGISSFGRWTLSSNNNALPVKFTLFNLTCDGPAVLLTWKTEQEQNSSHYVIERSGNSIGWTAIGSIPAAGNSSSERSYSFTDNDQGQNIYYRISQYDIDGRVTYTNTLRSGCSKEGEFKVWPNPFSDKIFVHVPVKSPLAVRIKLFDSKGALIKKQNTIILNGINQLTSPTGGLSNGMYTLSADWNEGQMHKTIQVIKQ